MPKRVGANHGYENKKRNSISSKRKFNKLSSQGHNDDKIKSPMKFKSPYIFFSLSKQNGVMEELGDSGNVNDAARRIAEMWKILTPEERHAWEIKSSTDKIRYQEEKINYEKSKQAPIITCKKEKTIVAALLGVDPPSPPSTAFMHYCQEIKPIVIEKYPAMSASDVGIVTGEMWKNISAKDREYFLKLEIGAKASYEEKLQDWMKVNENSNQVPSGTYAAENIKNTTMDELKIKSSKKDSNESSDEYSKKASIPYSFQEGSNNSDESSLDGSTSNDEDLQSKIGKSRSRTPPFLVSNPALAINRNNFVDLAGASTSANIHELTNAAAAYTDLNNLRRNSNSASVADELNHRYRIQDLAGEGVLNYISSTSAGGLSIPNANYLSLLGATQSSPNVTAATTTGAPGIVLVNPSSIIQPNQMYLQHPGLLSSLPPTVASARTAGSLPLQQPLLVQFPLNARRQLQNQFPAYFMEGRGQL